MPNMTANTLTLLDAITALKNKTLSYQELYDATYSVIRTRNKETNTYLTIAQDKSRDAEKLRDFPLAGIPLAVKDNFLTKDLATTASSKVLDGFMPQYESTVTARVQAAGGITIGKTNMDAWAHGSSTETSDWGTTKNPRNTAYSPGGSSGGSAAAVAADMCIAAIGSETAGSIRIPAAWCGIVGLKPTYGRVSRAGVVAMGSSLDSPGPMTKTVADAAFLLEHMAGHDTYDATTSNVPVDAYSSTLRKGVKGLKIGIVYIDHPQLVGSKAAECVIEAGKLFAKYGAEVEIISLSEHVEKGKILTPQHAIAVYTVLQRSEVSSNLARYDGIRYGHGREAMGGEAKRRIMLGTYTLSKGYADKYYTHAQQVRTLYVRNFQELFSKYDLLISTPSPGYALPIGESAKSPMFGELVDMLNEPSSLAGLPAISVPCYHDEKTNLYLGLCIMGNHFQEEKLLQAAYLYEQQTKWNSWRTS